MAGGLSAVVAKRIVPKLAVYAPLKQVSGSVASSSPLSKQASLLDVCQSFQKLNKRSATSTGNVLFAGVEVTIEELGTDDIEQKEASRMIQEHGLELLVNLDIQGGSNQPTIDLVQSFENQLKSISDLGSVVSHVNCSSGSNHWPEEARLEYLLEVLPLSAKFLEDHSHIGKNGNETDIMGGAPDHLTGISHETSGMLHQPDVTRQLLEIIPPLRLTMDLSSWHHECGYPWGWSDSNSDEDEEEVLSVEIVPHIDLIRTNLSLLSDETQTKGKGLKKPTLDGRYLRTHQSLWETVWARKSNRGVKQLYMTLDDDESTCHKKVITNSNSEMQNSSRMKRLKDAANSIHRHYDNWSRTTNKVKAQSS